MRSSRRHGPCTLWREIWLSGFDATETSSAMRCRNCGRQTSDERLKELLASGEVRVIESGKTHAAH